MPLNRYISTELDTQASQSLIFDCEEFTIISFKIIEDIDQKMIFLFPTCIYPLHYSEINLKIERKNVNVSSLVTGLIPAKTEVRLSSLRPSGEFIFLILKSALIKKASKVYQLKDYLSMFSKLTVIERKNWHNELIHRLKFASFSEKNPQTMALEFTPLEIAKELYYGHVWEKNPKMKDTFGIDQTKLQKFEPRLDQVIDYIEAKLFEPITLNHLIEQFAIPQMTLIRLFKKNINITPIKYIRDRKLREAHDLLRNTSYTVSEVAKLLSFTHSSQFINLFKKKFNQTPGETIRQYRK